MTDDPTGFSCASCSGTTQVIDSRRRTDGTIRRRRKCLECGERQSTVEITYSALKGLLGQHQDAALEIVETAARLEALVARFRLVTVSGNATLVPRDTAAYAEMGRKGGSASRVSPAKGILLNPGTQTDVA